MPYTPRLRVAFLVLIVRYIPCMHAGTPKAAIVQWEAAWCDAMLDVLASPVPRLAANVSAYGLSVPLAMESGSLVTLLKRILTPVSSAEHGSYSDGQVIAALHC